MSRPIESRLFTPAVRELFGPSRKEKISQGLKHLTIIPESTAFQDGQDPFELAHTIQTILNTATHLGIQAVSIQFSEDPKHAPYTLLEQILSHLSLGIDDLHIRFRPVGNIDQAPRSLQESILKLEEQTKTQRGVTFFFPINYSGKNEITEAIRGLREEGLQSEEITEEEISQRLQIQPDPDLAILTGRKPIGEIDGKPEHMISLTNFAPWQLAYAELMVVPHRFEDISQANLLESIAAFSDRSRRKGGLEEQNALKR